MGQKEKDRAIEFKGINLDTFMSHLMVFLKNISKG
jgi:hypothetical protein